MTRRSCELAAVATWFAIVTCGTTDCLAMNSYSSITGTLHVDGAYSVGDVVYDIDLQKNNGDPGQLLVGDGFVLQAAIQSTRPTSVPSVFSGDTGILRPRPTEHFVVNVDAAESDLQLAPASRLAALQRPLITSDTSPGGKNPKRRVELWHAMGWMLLLILLGESLLLRQK